MNRFVDFSINVTFIMSSLILIKSLIHFFQLESYQFRGYLNTIKRNFKKAFYPNIIVAASLFSLYTLLFKIEILTKNIPVIISSILFFIIGIFLTILVNKFFNKRISKTPLVYTARIKRLYVISFLTFSAISFGITKAHLDIRAIIVLHILLPLFVAVAAFIVSPIEKTVKAYYLQDAKKKLNSIPGLIKIGITGSYGKTSVKFILDTMLKEKYNTLPSPGSYNTPMGLTKTIRSDLKPSHEIFIAEMGARHKRDIKELCRFIEPDIGILTSIGAQHLETFKKLETIIETKYNLIEALPAHGESFFVYDNDISLELYKKTSKNKTIVSINKDKGDIWAEQMISNRQGTTFKIRSKEGFELVAKTELLGTHNVQNILLATAVCIKLGLSKEQIQRGISDVKPVKHRLELIKNTKDITVIDDSFNSNPQGVKAALEVLKKFEGRKIIITPGMVEMGLQEDKYNKSFGKDMAKCVDIAILIGEKHTKPIVEGLLESGFDRINIFVVNSLEESSKILEKMVKSGDVLLYENDLPDHYDER